MEVQRNGGSAEPTKVPLGLIHLPRQSPTMRVYTHTLPWDTGTPLHTHAVDPQLCPDTQSRGGGRADCGLPRGSPPRPKLPLLGAQPTKMLHLPPA